jgi:acyl carrier protein
MSTLETLQAILIKEFELRSEQLAPTAALDTLGIDSLDMLELMFKIEDRYGVKIRDDTPTDLKTVGDVVSYIDGLIARSPHGSGAPAGLRPIP